MYFCLDKYFSSGFSIILKKYKLVIRYSKLNKCLLRKVNFHIPKCAFIAKEMQNTFI